MIYGVRFTKEAKKDISKLTPKLKQKLKKNHPRYAYHKSLYW